MLAKLSLSDGRQYRAKMRWKAIEHKWKSREFRIFSSKCGWEKPISKILEITSVFLIVLSKNNKPSFHSVMQRKGNCCPLVIMQNSCNDFGFEISKCAHINIYIRIASNSYIFVTKRRGKSRDNHALNVRLYVFVCVLNVTKTMYFGWSMFFNDKTFV